MEKVWGDRTMPLGYTIARERLIRETIEQRQHSKKLGLHKVYIAEETKSYDFA